MPDLLDPLLRTAGVVGALLMAAVLMRPGTPGRMRAALPVLAGAAAYLVCSAPSRSCVTDPFAAPLLLAAIAFPFAFWWWVRAVLEDRLDVPGVAWAGAALLLGAGTIGAAGWLDVAGPVAQAAAHGARTLGAGFVAAALVPAWRGLAGDLLEARRRIRGVLLGGIGAYTLLVLVAETILRGAAPPAWLALLNLAAIDVVVLSACVWLVGPRAEAVAVLAGDRHRGDGREPVGAPAGADAATVPAASSARRADDDADLARLLALMVDGHRYRDPQLDVASLARDLGLPEYRLRALIRERLGHRHFAAFVNRYRLDEVERRMADPAAARRPILTLALEAGFGSIGPFNRAFRDRHGITPTEFRQRLRS